MPPPERGGESPGAEHGFAWLVATHPRGDATRSKKGDSNESPASIRAMNRAAHLLLALTLVGGCDKDDKKSEDGDDGTPSSSDPGDSSSRGKRRAEVRG